jgi:hypothetical protein
VLTSFCDSGARVDVPEPQLRAKSTIALAASRCPTALAVFGRRPPERAGLSLLSASKNQHNSGH